MSILGDLFDITPTGMVVNALGESLGPAVLAASDQAADIDAIHNYIANTQVRNSKAQGIKDRWMQWSAGLSWYQKHVDTNVGAEAFNIRNDFMRANALPEEKAAVDNFLKKVPAFDPVTGNPNFVDSKGDRMKAPEPLIPTTYKVAAVIGGAAVAVLVVLKKLTII